MNEPTAIRVPVYGALRGAQHGVVLLISLIVLVAMTLAGIAVMRSVDTNVLIAGNLAFRNAALSAADALDASQETFGILFRKLSDFRFQSKFSSCSRGTPRRPTFAATRAGPVAWSTMPWISQAKPRLQLRALSDSAGHGPGAPGASPLYDVDDDRASVEGGFVAFSRLQALADTPHIQHPGRMVEPDGIEPTTSCLQSRRSPN